MDLLSVFRAASPTQSSVSEQHPLRSQTSDKIFSVKQNNCARPSLPIGLVHKRISVRNLTTSDEFDAIGTALIAKDLGGMPWGREYNYRDDFAR